MRSESIQILYPVLRYADVAAAVRWLERAFQFEEEMTVVGPDGNAHFALMRVDGAKIMLSSTPAEDLRLTSPKSLGATTAAVHVYVHDIDAHYWRAVASNVEIVRPLADTEHGTRNYDARDLEGHVWAFSTHRP